ncbi:hypothetical protein SmJEL517_g03144 [Synchytrium microbalum]|uniref:Eukaryotic translation initiation factor 4E n=1 Tax=Synchytrium microbalum TaxID=1806994 RepID=A0A507BZJ4_9FUNG|nr:uncharacterized protein SmJEL517_g03144 [Synchytrium microbalum]TPX34227.1 hypothetical protein SmJEL517_g03144 [Synchytrium microbalum]
MAPAEEKTAETTTESPATDIITVFDDPINFTHKHPLQHKWCVWFDSAQGKQNQKNWMDNLKNLVTFDSVEDFWGIMNHIMKASALPAGSNYHVFKEGIQPMWEDPQNKKGGKWVVSITKKHRGQMDTWWLNTLMGMIGEAFEDGAEIMGAVVSARRSYDRISLWTKTGAIQDVQERIGKQFKQIMGVDSDITLGYQMHDTALKTNSSYGNDDIYQV